MHPQWVAGPPRRVHRHLLPRVRRDAGRGDDAEILLRLPGPGSTGGPDGVRASLFGRAVRCSPASGLHRLQRAGNSTIPAEFQIREYPGNVVVAPISSCWCAIAGRPTTANSAHNMHHHAVSHDRRQWRGSRVAARPGQQGSGDGGAPFDGQAIYRRGPMPDTDAVAPAFKGFLDGLVDGVLPGDTVRLFVRSVIWRRASWRRTRRSQVSRRWS